MQMTLSFVSFSPDSVTGAEDAVLSMTNCLADIKTWMVTDKLKLNDDKTEFLILGTRQQLSKVN